MNVTEDFINNYFKKRNRILSFWGGHLSFDHAARRLNKLKADNVYYKSHYKNFYEAVYSEKDSDKNDKVIVKLDVQNFFEEVQIAVLLDLIDQHTRPSEKRRTKYDVHTRIQIEAFFSFLVNNSRGIPQLDNDILSGWIGYLYLIFGDLLIDDEIRMSTEQIKEHRIYRYVDDIYIVLVFKEDVSQEDRDLYVSTLGSRIADIFYSKLGLRLNHKTRLFRMRVGPEFNEFVDSLKKVSRDSEYREPNHPTTPQERIEKIFRQVKKLTQNPQVGRYFDYEEQPEDDTLKAVFDGDVDQIFNVADNTRKLRRAFRDFDFNLVKTNPLTLTVLILKDPTAAKRYRAYLLELSPITTREANLIVRYLCQTGFTDTDLIAKLYENDAMQSIMDLINKPNLQLDSPGYHNLDAQKTITLAEQQHIVEQIRLRVVSEDQNSYTVALNHLLNEFHAICWWRQSISQGSVPDIKKYRATDVETYLTSLRIPHEDCVFIRNMFDRRNENQISHPGSLQLPSESVSQQEYREYLAAVGRCLDKILS